MISTWRASVHVIAGDRFPFSIGSFVITFEALMIDRLAALLPCESNGCGRTATKTAKYAPSQIFLPISSNT